jgi:transposase
MQGNKQYQEKLFLNFRLSERVPENNFYRKLKDVLDFSFLRKQTASYYGTEGQSSIDPEVFFKLMLIGYIENFCSDRKIIENASMRMDMLYFLNYDVDESLPWHSTLSRTRKLYGEELFLNVFRQVLSICVTKGMVNGSRQAIDSAFIKANASISSLIERQIEEDSATFYQSLLENEDEGSAPKSKARMTENKKYVSTSDPDSRLSKKANKQKALNYFGQISVDTSSHVICGAIADFADKRDSQCLPKILDQTVENLHHNGIKVEEVLADSAYSSGSSLRYLEKVKIQAYIPCIGTYQPFREDFAYNEFGDFYECRAGVKIPFKGVRTDFRDNSKTKVYYSSAKDCQPCALRAECIKNAKFKQIGDTLDKPYYDKMYARTNSKIGQRMKNLRSSTVEPVIGTLLHFRGMKKVNTKGIDLANKHVLLAATAYNLKKLLAFKVKKLMNNKANMALKSKFNFLIWFLKKQIDGLLERKKIFTHYYINSILDNSLN